MKAYEFINNLRGMGRYSFTAKEAKKSLAVNGAATLNALFRLKRKGLITSPAKGFYLIVPPEYQVFGCLPANMFVADLMKHRGEDYYVGFLSAAQFYGAAHQKPQRFQVVTSRNLRPIKCARIHIEFIANQYAAKMPIKLFNTQTGTIRVAAPEVIAADMVIMSYYAAGINNATTVLLELAEHISVEKLVALTKIIPKLFWIQRLGYLLELLGFQKLADALMKTLKNKKLHWVNLVASARYSPLKRDKKWKIIVNANIEPDAI